MRRPGFLHKTRKKRANMVAKQKFNDIIKLSEIYASKLHQAVKTFH